MWTALDLRFATRLLPKFWRTVENGGRRWPNGCAISYLEWPILAVPDRSWIVRQSLLHREGRYASELRIASRAGRRRASVVVLDALVSRIAHSYRISIGIPTSVATGVHRSTSCSSVSMDTISE